MSNEIEWQMMTENGSLTLDYEANLKPIQFIFRKLIVENDVNIIYGGFASCKSFFVLRLIEKYIEGKDFECFTLNDLGVKKQIVLVDTEGTRFRERLTNENFASQISFVPAYDYNFLEQNKIRSVQELLFYIDQRFSADAFVFIDTVTGVLRCVSDNEAIFTFFRALKKVQRQRTFVLTFHEKKGTHLISSNDSLLGGTNIFNFASNVIKIKKSKQKVFIYIQKSRHDATFDESRAYVFTFDGNFNFEGTVDIKDLDDDVVVSSNRTIRDALIRKAWRNCSMLRFPLTQEDLATLFGISRVRVTQILGEQGNDLQ